MRMHFRKAIGVCLFAIPALGQTAPADLPKFDVVVPSASIHPGEPTSVQYRLIWGGDPEGWRVPAPEISTVDWGKLAVRSARTYVEGDSTIAEFEIAVLANRTGAVEIPALDFQIYSSADVPPNGAAPLKAAPGDWVVGDAVSSEPVTLAVTVDYSGWIRGAAIGGAIAGVLLVIGFVVYRAVPGPAKTMAATAPDDPREHIHAARKHRLDGDFYGFYQALARCAAMGAGPAAVKLGAGFKERAREVGYSGVRPTDDEMDAALKDVERTLTAVRG